MKKLILLLALFLPVSQAQVVCYSGTQVVAPCTPMTDAMYWASKDPRIADLQKLVQASGIPDIGARDAAAQKLDAAGLTIDRAIDIWGWSPSLVMQARAMEGFPWLPNAFQPNLVDPLHTGVTPKGSNPTDMSKPWPRSIKVSTLSADYPSLVPPRPPAAASDGTTWYFDSANGVYGLVASSVQDGNGKWLYAEGQPVTYKGQQVYFHLSYSIMGTFPQFVLRKP